MTPLVLDTSVAVPLVVATHEAHDRVHAWAAGRVLPLAGHAQVETFAVLTRLPGDLRLLPGDAVRLMAQRFGPAVQPAEPGDAVDVLAASGIAGGAAYDGLVALAARDAGAALATRDARAVGTYQRLGVQVVVVA